MRRAFAWALALSVAGSTSATAFELPGLGEILGTKDPLAVFPDTLPERVSVGFGTDVHDIYRSRAGSSTHAYGTQSNWTAFLARAGPVWAGVHWGSDQLDVANRDVFGQRDALNGGRQDEHVGVAVAARWRAWEVRTLLGASSQPDAALQLAGGVWLFERVAARAWIWSSRFDFTQGLDGSTYEFPFRYRDENAELRLTTQPLLGHRLTLEGRHQTIRGDKQHADDYNVLYIPRSTASARIERTGRLRVDAELEWDASELGIAMARGGARFVEVRELQLGRRSLEVGWRILAPLRVSVGRERWRLHSDYPSYFEPWPFSSLASLSAVRYRLEAIDMNWQIDYASVGWKAVRRQRFGAVVEGRFERWQDHGTLQWKERVPVMWPLFFRYDHHDETLQWPFTHAVQLRTELQGTIRHGWSWHFAARAIVPWRQGSAPATSGAAPPASDAPAPAGVDHSVGGGLRVNVALRYQR